MPNMDPLTSLLKEALDDFIPADSVSVDAPYVEVLSPVTEGFLNPPEEDAPGAGQRRRPAPALHDPISFLTREAPPPPFLACVVGQYGTGKTELLRQLAHVLGQDPGCHVLPLRLGRCHNRIHLLQRGCSDSDFQWLVFGDVFTDRGLERSAAKPLLDELLGLVRQGEVILLLDGLDELIFDREQYDLFFIFLLRLFRGKKSGAEAGPRAVLSMRHEFLASFDDQRASGLASHFQPADPRDRAIRLCFIKLDLFDSSRIREFLLRKIGGDGERVFDAVSSVDDRLEFLKRPLLLSLWCQSVKLSKIARGEILPEKLTAAEIFRRYIMKSSRMMRSQLPTRRTWDLEKIAYTSVDIYSEGRSAFTVAEISGCLRLTDGGSSGEANPESELSETLQAIHKCPFLQKKPGDEIDFPHRAFLEYFTAKGVALALQKKQDEGPFNELVLNVDMRKFLFDIIGPRKFKRQAHKAWGLADPETKRHPQYKDLIRHHTRLLDSMVEPGELPEKHIEEALEILRHDKISPRYLMYAYEAISIHLRFFRWKASYRTFIGDLGEILASQFHSTLEELKGEKGGDKWRLLLLDRIVDLTADFKLAWMAELKYDEEDWLSPLAVEGQNHVVEKIRRNLDRYKEISNFAPMNQSI